MKQIRRLFGLSDKAYNACSHHRLNSAFRIYTYYRANNNFTKLKRFDYSSSQELVTVCHILTNIEQQVLPVHDTEAQHDLSENFSLADLPISSFLLKKTFEAKAAQYSRRTQNVLRSLLNDHSDEINVLKFLRTLNGEYEQIPRIGRKSSAEFAQFVEYFNEYLFNSAKVNSPIQTSETNNRVKLDFLLQGLASLFGTEHSFIVTVFSSIGVHTDQNEIPVLALIQQLINANILLDERSTALLKYRTSYFFGIDPLNLEELGGKFGVTRERVRQLSRPDKLLIPFWSKIRAMIELISNSGIIINAYGIDSNADLIKLDAQLINEIDGTHFTHSFLTKVFSIILDDYSCIIGENDDSTQHKYLMRKELLRTFDFNRLLIDFGTIQSKEIAESYSINFYDKLPKYMTSTEDISKYARELISLEFGYESDEKGIITIPRTTKKLKYEFLEEILDVRRTPMHYEELYSECQQRGIRIKSALSVHSALQNHPEVFGLKGPGYYGLKKWGGYFGTIGDVAERILRENGAPMKVRLIKEIVTHELYVSDDSIMTVLLFYPGENRFVRMKDKRIALREWLQQE